MLQGCFQDKVIKKMTMMTLKMPFDVHAHCTRSCVQKLLSLTPDNFQVYAGPTVWNSLASVLKDAPISLSNA